MLCFSKAGVASQCHDLRGREETDEGRPACSRPLRRHLQPGPHLGVRQFQRKQERHGECRSRRKRRNVAQRRRVRFLGEIHADARGHDDSRLASVEAGRRESVPPGCARLEIDRYETQPIRDTEAELDQALTLPRLRAGLINLKNLEARRDLRPPLREAVQAGAEDDVLAHSEAGLFHNKVFDEAGAADDRGAKRSCELRIHVAASKPAFTRGQQLEADLVVQHMRRGIHRDMQRTPQRNPRGRALRRNNLLVIHSAQFLCRCALGNKGNTNRPVNRSRKSGCGHAGAA